MSERPTLNKQLDSNLFLDFYYLKEELVVFCRANDLPISGGKVDITNRIVHFLNTGEVLKMTKTKKRNVVMTNITLDSEIEKDFVCSEVHRAFFKEQLGNTFSFNVVFQNWLKSNQGKNYSDALMAYHQILEDKKKGKTKIDKQFEYNTYIRDFFADNQGNSLEEAIKCWKYKKELQGHNRYEKSDLIALEN